jgi:hypothetical protein
MAKRFHLGGHSRSSRQPRTIQVKAGTCTLIHKHAEVLPATLLSYQDQVEPGVPLQPVSPCWSMPAGAASPSGQPQEDPFRPKSDRDTARAAAAVGVLGGQPTATLQLLGDVKLREFFNDGGKVTLLIRVEIAHAILCEQMRHVGP